MQSCQSFLFRGWKWPLTPQLTYLLLLATCLTLDLLWNADCQRLPNLEQFKRICTLSLICVIRKITQDNQSFQTTENRVIWFLLHCHCHCFSSSWKNADVENQKSTVLTDAPAEVQPCEGWCFPVGERDWQPWQPWPQVVYIFIHEPTWTKALRANCPLLSQNRLRAVMMRAHCRQNGSMNLCKAVLLVKAIRSRNFSYFSTCQNHQKHKFFLFEK